MAPCWVLAVWNSDNLGSKLDPLFRSEKSNIGLGSLDRYQTEYVITSTVLLCISTISQVSSLTPSFRCERVNALLYIAAHEPEAETNLSVMSRARFAYFRRVRALESNLLVS